MSAPGSSWGDVLLEEAIQGLRRRCRRLAHGRVWLVVERDGGDTTDYQLGGDPLTTRDVQRIMVEPPHGRKEEVA